MSIISDHLLSLKETLPAHLSLVAVSKTKSAENIKEAYLSGQHIFGENKVQELCQKQSLLPKDISWHMIGHLQRNKVKYIAPFISLIHSVDSLPLLKEIERQAIKNNRTIDCLLQVHIAKEDSKFGLSEEALHTLLEYPLKNVSIKGFMGMATNTSEKEVVISEFQGLKKLFDRLKKEHSLEILSMGMSGDYKIAIDCGSNMIRVGSLIFGSRT